MTPHDAFKAAIARWEGAWQAMPSDHGNYTPKGKLVGTMRGVTVNTYAAFLNTDPEVITAEMMQTGITLDVAAQVYEEMYYRTPGFDKLPWSPLVEAVADFGWGSGPGTAVRQLQKLVGTPVDGVLGPRTMAAVRAYLGDEGDAKAVDAFAFDREEFYHSLDQPKFLDGWLKRAAWYTSTNKEWFWAGANGSRATPDMTAATLSQGAPMPTPDNSAADLNAAELKRVSPITATHVAASGAAIVGVTQIAELIAYYQPGAPAAAEATLLVAALGFLFHLLSPFLPAGVKG